MRSRLRLAFGVVGLLSIAASDASAGLKVFACLPEWKSLTETLGGPNVEVTRAASPLDNPEGIQPTPSLLGAYKDADLLVCTGAGLEDGWLDSLRSRAPNPRIAPGAPGHFLASAYVELIKGHDDHEGDAHAHAHGNPHIHSDPRNMRKVAARLGKRLIQLDPDNKAEYTERTKTFIRELGQLIAALEAKAAPLAGINIASQHDHSIYLLEWLKIENAATVEPEPGVPPGPEHLAEIIEAVPENNIRFVIYAPYEDPSPSEFVAERAGIRAVKVPFTVGGTEEAKDLFSFYEDSVARLLDGLAGRERG